MMVRLQVTLDPETHRSILERAAQLGISASELVRRAVQKSLDVAPAPSDPARIFNLGFSPGSDVARDKAAMLGEAVAGLRSGPLRAAG